MINNDTTDKLGLQNIEELKLLCAKHNGTVANL